MAHYSIVLLTYLLTTHRMWKRRFRTQQATLHCIVRLSAMYLFVWYEIISQEQIFNISKRERLKCEFGGKVEAKFRTFNFVAFSEGLRFALP